MAAHRRALKPSLIKHHPGLFQLGRTSLWVCCCKRAGSFSERTGIKALLHASDILTLGALFALQSMGFAVPDDISIVGMEDLPAFSTTWPALTSIRLPLDLMGHRTAWVLQHCIEKGTQPTSLKLPSELVLSRSTQCL
ncbi:MAG: substrate-binding domain-containing protein [Paracoccaceae bacterium]